MTRYAERTTVTPEKSQFDIQRLLQKYCADGVLMGQMDICFTVGFTMSARKRSVRINLPLPVKEEYPSTRQYEQAVRQAMRALYLVVKAKLESVESGIETFDEAFMAHIVMPGANGRTIGQTLLPRFQETLAAGEMPKLLPEVR